MKDMPLLLLDAFQQTISLERIHMPLKVNLPIVKEIDNHVTTQIGGEIKAVRAQLNQLNSKKSQFKH